MNLFGTLSVAAVVAVGMANVGTSVSAEELNSVSIGGYFFNFSGGSSALSGPYTPQNAKAWSKNLDGIAFTYRRTFARQWSIDLDLGVPPAYKITGEGSVKPLGQIASARSLSPAVLLNRHWAIPSTPLQPFLGVGLNYNHFMNLAPSQSLNAALGGVTQISVRDSFAPVVTAGSDFQIGPKMFITGSISFADVSAHTKLVTNGIGRYINIYLNPVIYQISAGYRF